VRTAVPTAVPEKPSPPATEAAGGDGHPGSCASFSDRLPALRDDDGAASGAEPGAESGGLSGPAASPPLSRVDFCPTIELTKGEVFAACQVLVDVDRVLSPAGHAEEHRALVRLFELLEDRLTACQSASGVKSIDSEFTQ